MSLSTLIPDAEVLLALPPEELAFYVLRAAVDAAGRGGMLHKQSFQNDIFGVAGREPAYPQRLHNDIEVAVSEAWQWLENQLLIVPASGTNVMTQ